jgi:hypothetical protein
VTGQFDLAQLKMSRSLTDQKSKICRDLGWIKKAKKNIAILDGSKKPKLSRSGMDKKNVAILDG